MAVTKSTAKPAVKPAVTPEVTVVDLGSTSIQPGGRQAPAAPAGTLHLVAGWEPLCGGERVRFVFPGRPVPGEDTCPACVKATLPRPRTAARSSAGAR